MTEILPPILQNRRPVQQSGITRANAGTERGRPLVRVMIPQIMVNSSDISASVPGGTTA